MWSSSVRRNAAWKMAVMQRPVVANKEGLEAIYADITSKLHSKTREEALGFLRGLEMQCDEAATHATRIVREATRRDPAQSSECVKKSKQLGVDLASLSNFFF